MAHHLMRRTSNPSAPHRLATAPIFARDMFCRSATLLRVFTLLRWMTCGLHLARHRIGVQSYRSARFPPDILPGGIACAGAGHNIGKDQRVPWMGTTARLFPAPLMYSTGKAVAGRPMAAALASHWY